MITYGNREATAHLEEFWGSGNGQGLGDCLKCTGQTIASRLLLASDDVMHINYIRKHSLVQQLFFSYHSKTFPMKKVVHRIAFQYKLRISPPTGNSLKTSTLKSTYCSGKETNLVLEISVTAIKYFISVGLRFFMFNTEMAEVHLPSNSIILCFWDTGDAKF